MLEWVRAARIEVKGREEGTLGYVSGAKTISERVVDLPRNFNRRLRFY